MSDSIEDKISEALNEDNDTKDTNSTQEPIPNTVDETPKIKAGGNEYSQEELDKLVGLGKIASEAEVKYSTKIDKVWPEYTKSQQELKELRKVKEEYEKVQAEKAKLPENEEQAIKEAKEAAKRLGILTDDDFEAKLETTFGKYYQQERAAERLLEAATKLEKEISGDDGRPAFNTQEVLEYMRDNMGGQGNLETAYKLMHEDKLESWKEQQLSKSKKPGMTTTTVSGGGTKEPPKVKVTEENLDQLVAEMFN